jgi:hypothetical protein
MGLLSILGQQVTMFVSAKSKLITVTTKFTDAGKVIELVPGAVGTKSAYPSAAEEFTERNNSYGKLLPDFSTIVSANLQFSGPSRKKITSS